MSSVFVNNINISVIAYTPSSGLSKYVWNKIILKLIEIFQINCCLNTVYYMQFMFILSCLLFVFIFCLVYGSCLFLSCLWFMFIFVFLIVHVYFCLVYSLCLFCLVYCLCLFLSCL